MDFWSTVRVLLRRWYVALPIFVVSLGLAGGVYLSVSPQYESQGTLVLTAPAAGARVAVGDTIPAEKINPLLAFDGSLTTSAQIIIAAVADPAVAKQFSEVGGVPSSYEVSDGKLAGPFIVVVATAGSPSAAEATVAGVLEKANQELNSRQTELQAPASTFIRANVIVNPTPSAELVGGKVRFAAVALMLGIIGGLTAAYGYESYQQHRAGKPDPEPGQSDKPESHPLIRATEAKVVGDANGRSLAEEPTRVFAPVAKPPRDQG